MIKIDVDKGGGEVGLFFFACFKEYPTFTLMKVSHSSLKNIIAGLSAHTVKNIFSVKSPASLPWLSVSLCLCLLRLGQSICLPFAFSCLSSVRLWLSLFPTSFSLFSYGFNSFFFSLFF